MDKEKQAKDLNAFYLYFYKAWKLTEDKLKERDAPQEQILEFMSIELEKGKHLWLSACKYKDQLRKNNEQYKEI